jgi:N-acetyl-1-D-myo-inositol-2-amino-2-deoxy-alpha-D-glucopyranoside deacetylase/mycothiol S-conjugate amidase
MKDKTLIFVGAHPDDESFGLGGTLAKYALVGARVYYACATRGEVGAADPEHMVGHATPGDMRWAELLCASEALGLAEVFHLGYRDSGMPGSPENQHPQALAAAPLEEVTARVVRVLREVQPQVVITFDPIGGYRHPDHIAIHNATVRAFHTAGDPSQFPELGPAYQPQKLYYQVFSRRWLKMLLRLSPLFGVDPRRFGRNRDVDVVSLAEVEFPTHARIWVSGEAAVRRQRASACHKSQLTGGPPMMGLLGRLVGRIGNEDQFMRAYPEANGASRESDLFEGVV